MIATARARGPPPPRPSARTTRPASRCRSPRGSPTTHEQQRRRAAGPSRAPMSSGRRGDQHRHRERRPGGTSPASCRRGPPPGGSGPARIRRERPRAPLLEQADESRSGPRRTGTGSPSTPRSRSAALSCRSSAGCVDERDGRRRSRPRPPAIRAASCGPGARRVRPRRARGPSPPTSCTFDDAVAEPLGDRAGDLGREALVAGADDLERDRLARAWIAAVKPGRDDERRVRPTRPRPRRGRPPRSARRRSSATPRRLRRPR